MKFQCSRCSRGTVRSTYVTERVEIDGQSIMIKGIPVGLCPRCGERYYPPRVQERIKSLAEEASSAVILFTNEFAPPGGGTILPAEQSAYHMPN